MIRGISENRLIEILEIADEPLHRDVINQLIDNECKELSPWLPTDENTPINKYLLFKTSHCKLIGQWDNGVTWVDDHGSSIEEIPTHWQELPEDPK